MPADLAAAYTQIRRATAAADPRAVVQIAQRARSATECRELLDALGLSHTAVVAASALLKTRRR